MTIQQISKWIFILCFITLLFNGFLYFGIHKQELLYSIFPAIFIGIVSGAFWLVTKKKNKS